MQHSRGPKPDASPPNHKQLEAACGGTPKKNIHNHGALASLAFVALLYSDSARPHVLSNQVYLHAAPRAFSHPLVVCQSAGFQISLDLTFQFLHSLPSVLAVSAFHEAQCDAYFRSFGPQQALRLAEIMAIHDNESISRRGEQQSNIAIAFLVCSWVFILLRIWTRTFVIANFGWDDSTMIFAGVTNPFYRYPTNIVC